MLQIKVDTLIKYKVVELPPGVKWVGSEDKGVFLINRKCLTTKKKIKPLNLGPDTIFMCKYTFAYFKKVLAFYKDFMKDRG